MDYTSGLCYSISECHNVHARDPIAKEGAVTSSSEGCAAASAEPAQQLQGASATSGFWLKDLFIIVPPSSQLISTVDCSFVVDFNSDSMAFSSREFVTASRWCTCCRKLVRSWRGGIWSCRLTEVLHTTVLGWDEGFWRDFLKDWSLSLTLQFSDTHPLK